jgi:hypothetical protein
LQAAYSSTKSVSGFEAKNAFVITWYLVPLEQNTTNLQTFQIVLVTDGSLSFFIVNYERLDYPTADDHPVHYTADCLTNVSNIDFYFNGFSNTTNCNVNGRWIFGVDGDGSSCGPGIARKYNKILFKNFFFFIFNAAEHFLLAIKKKSKSCLLQLLTKLFYQHKL